MEVFQKIQAGPHAPENLTAAGRRRDKTFSGMSGKRDPEHTQQRHPYGKDVLRLASARTKTDTGKYSFREQSGASLTGHALARFIKILGWKSRYIAKQLQFADTWKYRVCQYDHVTDTCTKVPLSARWKTVGGHEIQRASVVPFC